MTEHDIQNLIRIELTKKGYRVFRVNVGKFKLLDGRWFDVGLPIGFSDLFVIKDGRISFIEVKAAKGRVSDHQTNFLAQMKKLGCKAGVARSVQDALQIMEEKC